MAQFAIEIADEDVDRVMNAVAANYSWLENVANPDFDETEEVSDENPQTITNPETKYQFTNRMVRAFLSDHVRAYEIKVAKEAAANAVDTVVDITNPHLSE